MARVKLTFSCGVRARVMGCVYINHFLNGLIRRHKVQKGRKAGEREGGWGKINLKWPQGKVEGERPLALGYLRFLTAAATAAT